jgi:hypothetical protein
VVGLTPLPLDEEYVANGGFGLVVHRNNTSELMDAILDLGFGVELELRSEFSAG